MNLAVILVASNEPLNAHQSNAAIRDGKGNVVYAPVIALEGEDADELLNKLEALQKNFLEQYESIKDSRGDLIHTLQPPKDSAPQKE